MSGYEQLNMLSPAVNGSWYDQLSRLLASRHEQQQNKLSSACHGYAELNAAPSSGLSRYFWVFIYLFL